MKRVVVIVISLGILIAIIFANALFWTTGDDPGPESEPSTITDYQADFVLDADGDMHVTETLILDFLFDQARDIPVLGSRRPDRTEHPPNAVRHVGHPNGEDEPFEELKEDHRRFTNIKIGSATETLGPGRTGLRDQVLHDGAIQPGENVDGDSQFYWS